MLEPEDALMFALSMAGDYWNHSHGSGQTQWYLVASREVTIGSWWNLRC